MFVIDYIALEDAPDQVHLPCEQPRKRHLCVRAVCCTSHQGMAGVDVHLGTVQDVGAAAKKFKIGLVEYGVIDTKATNDHGWAGFANASDHEAKTCAVWIEVAGYHPVDAPDAPIVARAVDFRADHHTVLVGTARSQIPLIPGDFDGTVAGMAAYMTRVRLLVDHGPNLGNQSAALALIQNLRRAGYDGPIDALVDSHDNIEQWVLTMKFDCRVVNDQNLDASIQDVYTRIEAKLTARYANATVTLVRQGMGRKTIKFANEDDVYPCPPGENGRLARCFQDLPFPYRLTVSQWNTKPPKWPGEDDDDEEEEDPLVAARRDVPRPDLAGNTAPTEATDYPVTFMVELDIWTSGEENLDVKLKRLDKVYDGRDSYPGVTWTKKDGAGGLPAFDDDVSGTATIVGMVAGGEYESGGVETYRKDYLKTKSAIAIQPLLWHTANRFYRIKDGATVSLCLPDAAAYFVEPLVVADAPALFRAQIDDTQGNALGAIAAAAGGACDLMVCYGVHQARSSSSAIVLDNLARGLAKAIADGAVKKTILLVICKEGVDLPIQHAKVVKGVLDGNLAGKIGNLQADQILFVHALPLPQRTFQVLAQKGTLPLLLEGANTCNMMQMLGKPYLSVCTQTTPYVEVPGAGDGHTKLDALTAALNTAGAGGRDDRVGKLATYFGAAKDGGAVLDGYFTKLKNHVKQKPLDQVKWALYRLKKALDNAPAPSSAQCRPTS